MEIGNKKAVVFTLMAIFLSSVLLIILALSSKNDSFKESSSEILRVKMDDRLINAFDNFIAHSLGLSAQTSLDNLSFIVASDKPANMNYDPFERWFHNRTELSNALWTCMFTNDQVSVMEDSVPQDCDGNTSMISLLSGFSSLIYEVFNINISYKFFKSSFSVTDYTPFKALLNVTAQINLTDSFANWSVKRNYSVEVSLEGITDPLIEKFRESDYTNNQFYSRRISETTINPDSWNYTNFISFLASGNYTHTTHAPSILSRYCANFTPSRCCGVETLITSRGLKKGKKDGFSQWRNYSFIDHELLRINNGKFSPPMFTCQDNNLLVKNTGVLGVSSKDFRINSSVLAGRYNLSKEYWISACE